jgi:sulfide dehydrogenase cytochrome subunit
VRRQRPGLPGLCFFAWLASIDSLARSVDIRPTERAINLKAGLMRRVLAAAGVAVTLLYSANAPAQTPPREPIRYVAANCTNCHGTMGRSNGATPSIAGLQKAYLVEQMRLFREGKRPATIMHQIARGYSDQQTEQLADYFSRLGAK